GGLRDLKTALSFLNSPVGIGYLDSQGLPTLRAAGKPIVLIPGNHDRYGRWHFPGCRNFDHVFGAFWHVGQGAQDLWVGQRGGETLILLGVDLSLRRHDVGSHPLGFLGRGRAYRKRLRELCPLTAHARSQSPGCALLWVLHFEPAANDPLLALLDERYLVAAIREQPPDAILCGHTHASNVNKVFDGIPVYVCGTTTQHASVHGNTLHVLEANVQSGASPPQFSCTVFRYDPAVARFV